MMTTASFSLECNVRFLDIPPDSFSVDTGDGLKSTFHGCVINHNSIEGYAAPLLKLTFTLIIIQDL